MALMERSRKSRYWKIFLVALLTQVMHLTSSLWVNSSSNGVSWFQQIASLTFGCVFFRLCISFTLFVSFHSNFQLFNKNVKKIIIQQHMTRQCECVFYIYEWGNEWRIEKENIYVTIISSFKIHWRFDKKLFRHTLYFSLILI